MTDDELARELAALPAELKRQALDFIAFLRQRYGRAGRVAEGETSDLAASGFIGMWREREEMRDSSEWVREGRVREWAGRDG
jgi:hypothetical protein